MSSRRRSPTLLGPSRKQLHQRSSLAGVCAGCAPEGRPRPGLAGPFRPVLPSENPLCFRVREDDTLNAGKIIRLLNLRFCSIFNNLIKILRFLWGGQTQHITDIISMMTRCWTRSRASSLSRAARVAPRPSSVSEVEPRVPRPRAPLLSLVLEGSRGAEQGLAEGGGEV